MRSSYTQREVKYRTDRTMMGHPIEEARILSISTGNVLANFPCPLRSPARHSALAHGPGISQEYEKGGNRGLTGFLFEVSG